MTGFAIRDERKAVRESGSIAGRRRLAVCVHVPAQTGPRDVRNTMHLAGVVPKNMKLAPRKRSGGSWRRLRPSICLRSPQQSVPEISEADLVSPPALLLKRSLKPIEPIPRPRV